jgi:hypothetical protein
MCRQEPANKRGMRLHARQIEANKQGYSMPRMLWVNLCALCCAAFGSLAIAADASTDDMMKALYDNTLTCQGSETDNWLCYVWYYPNGSVREFQIIRRRDGNSSLNGREGTFTLSKSGSDTQLCQTFDGGAHTWCRTLAMHQVGDQWRDKLANGQEQKFSLLKGRLLLNFLTGTGNDPHILSAYKYPDYPPDPSRVMKDLGAAASR